MCDRMQIERTGSSVITTNDYYATLRHMQEEYISLLSQNFLLIRSNKMQQYAGIYLLQIYSTCFGCPSHSSSGVNKIVTAASGTGHIT